VQDSNAPFKYEKSSSWFSLFRNDHEAYFLRRLNRFKVEVLESPLLGKADGVGASIKFQGMQDGTPQGAFPNGPCAAHCPNPGRLMELLFPGTRVILEKRFRSAEKENRGVSKNRSTRNPKTDWTLVAVYPLGYPTNYVVPLYASRMNRLAETLILPRVFPGARTIRREVRWGNSQFDFFVEDAEGKGHFIEVKGCTLVAYDTAMFPDAPSSRAVRHIRELEEATQEGFGAHVIFIVSHGPAERFIPNLHTDPAFAASLSRVAPNVRIHTFQIAADSEGRAWIEREGFPVDLSHGTLAEEDRGSYLVALWLSQSRVLDVGALGRINFAPGWYVYAGSAQRGLSSRVSRHLRIGGKGSKEIFPMAEQPLIERHARGKGQKRLHWHVDYLSAVASLARAYPIASYRNLECELARGLAEIGGVPVKGFGSTDCGCRSHLYWFPPTGTSQKGVLELTVFPTQALVSELREASQEPFALSLPDSALPSTGAKAGEAKRCLLHESIPEQNPLFVDLLLRFRHVEAFRK